MFPSVGLVLTSTTLAQRLVDVPSSCDGSPLVDPAEPESSFLLDKIKMVPRCGLPMPATGPLLTEDEQDCVLDWIYALTSTAGAS